MKRSIIEEIADSYDPSVGAAVGIVAIIGIGGAVLVAPVAAGVGALIAGGTGALWGAGAVLGVGATISAFAVVPHMLGLKCYKHVLRKKLENGETMEKNWYFPGVREFKQKALAKREQSLKKVFDQQHKTEPKPKTPKPKQDPKPPFRPD